MALTPEQWEQGCLVCGRTLDEDGRCVTRWHQRPRGERRSDKVLRHSIENCVDATGYEDRDARQIVAASIREVIEALKQPRRDELGGPRELTDEDVHDMTEQMGGGA